MRSFLSILEHVEMRPAESRFLIGLVHVLFLFGDEGRDILFAGERVFDLVLKLLHRLEQSLSDRFVLGAVCQVFPLVRICLQIEQLILGRMQEALHVLIFGQLTIAVTGLRKQIERPIRVEDQLVAFIANAELQVQQIR